MTLQKKASPAWYERIILDFISEETINSVYDIGVGPKTEYLTIIKKYPSLKFFGVEANPTIYKKILENNFPGILFNKAIAQSGLGTFVTYFTHKENLMASGLIPYDWAKDGEQYQVEAMTLDEFDNLNQTQENILLWMDIEGYELNALKSGKNLISSGRVKILNLEVRSEWNGKKNGCTEFQIDNYLNSVGYEKKFVYNHYPLSHHHDAIYVLKGHKLPDSCQSHITLYDFISNSIKTKDGAMNIALNAIDSNIAIKERDDKIQYLRSIISKLSK